MDKVLGYIVGTLFFLIAIGGCVCNGILDKDIKIFDDVEYSTAIHGTFPQFELEVLGEGSSILAGTGTHYMREVHSDELYIIANVQGSRNNRNACKLIDPETGEPITYTKYLALYENFKQNYKEEYDPDDEIPMFLFEEIKKTEHGTKRVYKDVVTNVYYIIETIYFSGSHIRIMEPILDAETKLPITDAQYQELYGKEE